MSDFLYVLAGLAFFALAILYVTATERCEAAMTLDLWLGAAITLAILIYLTYALLRPEDF